MSTCRDILTDAYREIGSYANEAMSAADERNGMRRFNALMDDLAGLGVGEKLRDVDLALYPEIDAACMPNNLRLLASTGGINLSFPVAPENGSRFSVVDVNGMFAASPVTISRNGRKVEGAVADLTANTAGFNRTWMYRADLADWRRVTELSSNDEFPLARDCEDAFTVMLAMRLAPTDGASVQGETTVAFQRAQGALRARHRQVRNVYVDPVLTRRGYQAFPQGLNPWPR
ncbi:hypothetical protein [Caulobacter sp. FWC2]|uniref:hypothetical protein n=1 Tax=Caulobacter sp. FWC2 TaxID=69664 RepID=UPI000C15E942|nr:hypothetical protein [Caulobacter sp. FWC2]PIB91288.1 hypothetical protein CSW62_06685 [Caulobacter sp. FWC2]